MVRLVHQNYEFVCPIEANFILGRGHGSDIALTTPDISRRHATFHFDEQDNRWYVEDLNSMNGTFINDCRVFTAPIQHGDELRFGSHTFYFYTD